MHIETSADARQSRRHAAGDDHVGHASGGPGYLAAAASRFSMWWSGNRRSPALTAGAVSGTGLQGGNDDDVSQSNGDANLAPSEGCDTPTTSDPCAHSVRSRKPLCGNPYAEGKVRAVHD
jgi:hypothetical protein